MDKLDVINTKLDQLGTVVVHLYQQGETLMATIQDLQAAVSALTNTAASATDMLIRMTAANDPAALQTLVDEVNKATTDLQTAITSAASTVHNG